MERFLRAELPRHQRREVVRHLLARCPRCAETAAAAASQLGSPPESYDEAFANVQKRLEQMAALMPTWCVTAGPTASGSRSPETQRTFR